MDDKDTTIMLHLLSNPNLSNKEISKQSGISEATVSRRIKQLYDRNILLGKQLVINRRVLNQEVYAIFFHISSDWRRNIVYLQLIFKQHAYTSYQCKIFGHFGGLLVQLALPRNSKNKVDELIVQLRDQKLIETAELYIQSGNQIRYNVDPALYDEESRTFEIDFEKIRDSLHQEKDEISFQADQPVPALLTSENIRLISQLHQDANRSLAKIGESLGLSKQEVSRKKIQYNLDDWGYDTLYNRKEFGVFNQCFFILNSNLVQAKNLDTILSNHYPFQASIIPAGKFILLWINLPAINVMEFNEILQQRFDVVKFFLLGRNPKNYPPWDANIVDGDWDSSKDRIVKAFEDENFENMLSIAELIVEFEKYEISDLEERFDRD